MSTAVAIRSGPYGRLALLDMGGDLVTHAHEGLNLLFKTGGADASFVVGGRRVALTDDTCVVVNARTPHAFEHRPGAPTKVLTLHLAPRWLQDVALTRPGHERRVDHPDVVVSAATRRMLYDLVGMAHDDAALASGIFRLAECVLQGAASVRRADPKQAVRRSMASIRADLSRENSLDVLAREVGLSRTKFFEEFRAEVGVTPSVYANMCRTETAICKMHEGTASLSAVGYDLGFSAPPHFTRFFRSNVGVVPSEYRRMLQG